MFNNRPHCLTAKFYRFRLQSQFQQVIRTNNQNILDFVAKVRQLVIYLVIKRIGINCVIVNNIDTGEILY